MVLLWLNFFRIVLFRGNVLDVLAQLLRDALLQVEALLQIFSGGLANALLSEARLCQLLCQAGIHKVAMGFEVGEQLALEGGETHPLPLPMREGSRMLFRLRGSCWRANC